MLHLVPKLFIVHVFIVFQMSSLLLSRYIIFAVEIQWLLSQQFFEIVHSKFMDTLWLYSQYFSGEVMQDLWKILGNWEIFLKGACHLMIIFVKLYFDLNQHHDVGVTVNSL